MVQPQQPADFGCDLQALILVAVCGEHLDGRAYGVAAVNGFLYLVPVVADDAVGRVDNCLRGAIVPFQLDEPRRRILLAELQDVVNLCAAESIDALCIVSDYADGRVRLGELGENAVLCRVCVLVFVYEDVLKSPRILLPHFGELLEEKIRVEQQIVEVHGVGLAASLEISLVDLSRLAKVFRLVPLANAGVRVILVREDKGVFGFRYFCCDASRFVYLFVQPHFLHDAFDETLGVGRVVYGVVVVEAQAVTLEPQDSGEDAVKCAGPQVACRFRPGQLCDAVVHFPRRLVRKCE